jgi:hypothetical protein
VSRQCRRRPQAGNTSGRLAQMGQQRSDQSQAGCRHPPAAGPPSSSARTAQGKPGDGDNQSRLDHRRHHDDANGGGAGMWGEGSRRERRGRRQWRRQYRASVAAIGRGRALPPPARRSPEFAGLCAALLQLLVERDLTFAPARRREARHEVVCANLVDWGRYRVAPSPQSLGNFSNISRINNPPSQDFCTFKVAPGCSLIHDWPRPLGSVPACIGDGMLGGVGSSNT